MSLYYRKKLILDNITDHWIMSPTEHFEINTFSVSIPENIVCKPCTLQVSSWSDVYLAKH